MLGGSYGLYSAQPPMEDELSPPSSSFSSGGKDYYQMGLLLPETSFCSLHPWLGFFTRYIPDFQDHLRERKKVLRREGQLVMDVRRLKDTLNELELNMGSAMSDLTSFIGEVLAAREWERQAQRQFSVETNMPPRPRLSAIVIPFDEEDEKDGGRVERQFSKTLPARMKSLAEFTETLYRYSEEEEVPVRLRLVTADGQSRTSPLSSPGSNLSSTGSGRSPITKTRLRVTRSGVGDPIVLGGRGGHGGSVGQPGHISLLSNKILMRTNSTPVEEEEEEEEEVEEEKEGENTNYELTVL